MLSADLCYLRRVHCQTSRGSGTAALAWVMVPRVKSAAGQLAKVRSPHNLINVTSSRRRVVGQRDRHVVILAPHDVVGAINERASRAFLGKPFSAPQLRQQLLGTEAKSDLLMACNPEVLIILQGCGDAHSSFHCGQFRHRMASSR